MTFSLRDLAEYPVTVIRAGLERWGAILADRAQPGIFSQKRILMVPGLNHSGLAQALENGAVPFGIPIPLSISTCPISLVSAAVRRYSRPPCQRWNS